MTGADEKGSPPTADVQGQGLRYVGFDDLHIPAIDAAKAKSLCAMQFEKLRRRAKSASELVVHLKEYNKGEHGRHKYSVHLKLVLDGVVIVSDKAHGWDVLTALHKGFDDLAHLVEKKQ